jgi:predicted CXXCH cytochrome family protein
MRVLLIPAIIAISAFVLPVSGGPETPDQCMECHALLEDPVAESFKGDIHHQKGVSCADCHGGDPKLEDMEESMSEGAGFRGVPSGDDISVICSSCHSSAETMQRFGSTVSTDQFTLLAASVHGQQDVSGEENILQCTSCHNAHGVVPVDHPSSPIYPLNIVATCSECHSDASYMQRYNPALPVDQLSKYRTSIHGARNENGDPRVAECASCHGGHDIRSAADVKSRVYPTNIPLSCAECHADASYMEPYGLATDQFEEFAESVHGVALLKKNDLAAPACNDCHGNHGAIPPGVASISKVCGTCHALNAELFAESPHEKAFDELGMPECETCHGNHAIVAATDQLLGVDEEAVCSQCHGETDYPEGYAVAKMMRQLIDSLDAATEHARGLIEEAEQKGMEVGEPKYKLREARQARHESRTMVHSFDGDRFQEVVGKGRQAASLVAEEATQAIDEYHYRRMGLGVSTLIITILALSLYVYLKKSERTPREGGKSGTLTQ